MGILEDVKEKKEMVLKDAIVVSGDLTRAVVSEYYKKKNIGDLVPVTFGGRGVAYSITELSTEEAMFFQIAEVIMGAAKSRAIQSVENGLFDSLLGK